MQKPGISKVETRQKQGRSKGKPGENMAEKTERRQQPEGV